MNFMRIGLLAPVAILSLSAGLLTTGLQAQEPAADEAAADEPAKDLFAARCRTCHELETVTVQHHSRNEWQDIVHRMVQNGAQITEPEGEMIVAYLTSAHGPETGDAPQAASNAAQP